jgi:cell division protein ZapB
MDLEFFAVLERQVDSLLDKYAELQRENAQLREENRRLLEERQGVKGRIDAVLAKIERI